MDYITNMLVNNLSEVLNKKNKTGIEIKPFQVRVLYPLASYIETEINVSTFKSLTSIEEWKLS